VSASLPQRRPAGRTFDALVAAAAASAQGVDGAEAALERELANVEGGDWARLVPRVRSILRGERGEALHVGLDALDRAVLRRVLAAVGPA
jgi:hypothetical protein